MTKAIPMQNSIKNTSSARKTTANLQINKDILRYVPSVYYN